MLRKLLIFVCFITFPYRAHGEVFNFENFTLKNGMEVVVIPNHRAPIVSHYIFYKVGAIDEQSGKTGLAHMTEHMMFKGTNKVKPEEYGKIVADVGGANNASTSYDRTEYHATVPLKSLEALMALEADRMRGLKFDDKIFEPEHKVVTEEKYMRTDNNPSTILGDKISSLLWGEHPYARPVIGTGTDLENLTAKDVRDFYHKYYAPNNAILVVAGDITADELKPLAEKYYGNIKTSALDKRSFTNSQNGKLSAEIKYAHPLVRQPVYITRYIAPSINTATDKENVYALALLAEMIGGGSTSIFYQNLVVQRHILTSFSAYYSPFSLSYSTFATSFIPQDGADIKQAHKAIMKEIKDILNGAFSDKEIKDAKSRMLSGLIYLNDSPQGAASVVGEMLSDGVSLSEINSYPDKIKAISKDELIKAAKLIFNQASKVSGLLLPYNKEGEE